MKKNPIFGTFFLVVSMLLLSTSCKKDVINEIATDNLSISKNAKIQPSDKYTASSGELAKKLESDLLKSVRNATSIYHSTAEALYAGYVPDNHCVSVPGLGGMGYHWANPPRIDPAFDPMKPEVVLYATGPGGNLRLVAVEYIVLNIGQAAPMFGNQPFDVGGTPVPVPHWSLHVWLYENNPNGRFTRFNPNITCP